MKTRTKKNSKKENFKPYPNYLTDVSTHFNKDRGGLFKDNLSQKEVFSFFAVDGASVWDVWLRAEVEAVGGGEDGDGHQGGEEQMMRRHAGEVRMRMFSEMVRTNLTARALWQSLRKVC